MRVKIRMMVRNRIVNLDLDLDDHDDHDDNDEYDEYDDYDDYDGMRPFYLRPFYLPPLLPTSGR